MERDPIELNRTIAALRQLVAAETKLVVRTDDNFMLRFLRCSGYDAKLAFVRIKSYYQLKYKNPQWFADTPDCVRQLLSLGYFYVLNKRDRQGRIIYINQLGLMAVTKLGMAHQSQLHDVYTEIFMDDNETQLNGICVIVDVKDVSWKLLKWLTPANLRIAIKKAETFPSKKIVYHVVNPSPVLGAALKIILPFLSDATKENIHIHETWTTLHNSVDPSNLPVAYGGELNADDYKMIIDKNSEKLIDNLKLGYGRDSDV